jgi:hypothetical protein
MSGAVSEAAEALGYRSVTSIYNFLREHKRELERHAQELERQARELEQEAKEARELARWMRIVGEEESTEEEMEEAADQWAGLLTDLSRGK